MNSMPDRAFDFEQLLHPCEAEVFFREHWQREPLVITRNAPDHYGEIFRVSDVEAIVGYRQLQYSQLKVARAAEDARASQAYYVDSASTADTNRLFHSYDRGESIVLNFLQSYWEPAARLCAAFEQRLRFPAGVNAYVTPRNACGFPPHFDAHEAFILQVHGVKHWKLYRRWGSSPRDGLEEQLVPRERLGDPIREFDLHAGDLLYIPAGFVHEASTQGSSSIHATVGVRTYTLLDLLKEAIALESRENEDLDRSLPLGFLEESIELGETAARLERALAGIARRDRLEGARDRLKARLLERLRPLPSGHLLSLDQVDDVTLDTRVVKRGGMRCHVASEGSRAAIVFPGNRMSGPSAITPALRFIADSREPFAVSALPETLSDDGKVVLVKRAIREGLLQVA
jgi:ribosomal protein L16 Arg81 hydroxylase